MSKVAISCEGPGMDDLVDPRFGRAAGFLIVDEETGEHSFIQNGQNQARSQGAGIATGEMVANSGAKVVLTGFVGPKAYQVLEAAGIKVGQNLEGISASEALKRYKEGQVKFASGPNR